MDGQLLPGVRDRPSAIAYLLAARRVTCRGNTEFVGFLFGVGTQRVPSVTLQNGAPRLVFQ